MLLSCGLEEKVEEEQEEEEELLLLLENIDLGSFRFLGFPGEKFLKDGVNSLDEAIVINSESTISYYLERGACSET